MGTSGHVDSWYAATANPHPEHPRLRDAVECDALVVGGGFTGLSAALELAQRGYDTVLLEAERVGWGASGRNGGQIVSGYNKSMAEIARLVGPDDARHLWALDREARQILQDRVERHGIDCDLRWGYLLGALKPRHLTELRATLEEWNAYGHDGGVLLEAEAMQAMVACPVYLGGLYDPAGGQLHPLNYALGLAGAARRAGARLFEASPVRRLSPGERPVAETPDGAVRTRFVLLAGNAYLNPLGPEIDRTLRARIMPVGTYMIATEPLGPERARRLIPSGCAVADMRFVLNYYRLSADHRMLFGGGVSYSGRDPHDLRHAVRRVMLRFFPDLADAGIDHAWGGYVAITRNRLPHFGRLAPNILFAHGFSGHGVALTSLAGRVAAEALAGTAERFDVLARVPHAPFPGGRRLRRPILVLAMTWLRMRDLL